MLKITWELKSFEIVPLWAPLNLIEKINAAEIKVQRKVSKCKNWIMQILFISFKEDGKFVCEDNIIFESGKVDCQSLDW